MSNVYSDLLDNAAGCLDGVLKGVIYALAGGIILGLAVNIYFFEMPIKRFKAECATKGVEAYVIQSKDNVMLCLKGDRLLIKKRLRDVK